MATDSTRVVYAALAGNVLVAAAKYVAAGISGSTAMLTEAVHSSADCANQLLLLFGNHRSRRAPDEQHPFGSDGEMYFWTFVVAIMVLLVGGVVSLYQGIHELQDPHSIDSPVLTLGVLVLSAVFEGSSLGVSYKAYRRTVARFPRACEPVPLWQFIKRSKDPNLYESLLEDSAALIGLALAAVGVLGSVLLGLHWMDAAASIAIGLLLVADSFVIASATQSLIAGEPVDPALRSAIIHALTKGGFDGGYSGLQTLHLGPETVLVAVAVRPADRADAAPLVEHTDALRRCITGVDQRLRYVFFDLR